MPIDKISGETDWSPRSLPSRKPKSPSPTDLAAHRQIQQTGESPRSLSPAKIRPFHEASPTSAKAQDLLGTHREIGDAKGELEKLRHAQAKTRALQVKLQEKCDAMENSCLELHDQMTVAVTKLQDAKMDSSFLQKQETCMKAISEWKNARVELGKTREQLANVQKWESSLDSLKTTMFQKESLEFLKQALSEIKSKNRKRKIVDPNLIKNLHANENELKQLNQILKINFTPVLKEIEALEKKLTR